MNAATGLAGVLDRGLRAAAGARWLTLGVVTQAVPLLADVDGTSVAVSGLLAGVEVALGDVLILAVLRGSPSVSHVLIDVLDPA